MSVIEAAKPRKLDAPHLTIVLPGRLDRKDYNSNASLGKRIQCDIGGEVVVLDMFGLKGIRRASIKEQTVYDCRWTPAQYLRKIKQTIDEHPNSSTTIVGFSYGAQMGLLYAALDAGLGLSAVDKLVAIMPTNFYMWGDDSYSAGRDFGWMMRQYYDKGTINLDTVSIESRLVSLSDPSSEEALMRVPRRVLTAHTRPYDGFFDNSPIPVTVTGLHDSGVLGYVRAKTLIIAGANDTLNSMDVTYQIYEQLPRTIAKDWRVLPVQHDYRSDELQIDLVNNEVVVWLQE